MSSDANRPGTEIGISVAGSDTCLKVFRDPDASDITSRVSLSHSLSQPLPGHYRLYLEFRTIDISSRGVWIAIHSFDGADNLIEPNAREATPDVSGTEEYYWAELRDLIPVGAARTEIEIGLDREATGTLFVDRVEMFHTPHGAKARNSRVQEYIDGEIRLDMSVESRMPWRRSALIDLKTGACMLTPNQFVPCSFSLNGTEFKAQIEDFYTYTRESYSLWITGNFQERIGNRLIGPFSGTVRSDTRFWGGRSWINYPEGPVTGQLLIDRVEQPELSIRRKNNRHQP
jgi:hypothetical protein